jgi:hypothetical protein
MKQNGQRKGLWAPKAFVAAVLSSGHESEYGVSNWAREYAEPGYGRNVSAELGILFGNWNDRDRWNPETNLRDITDRRPSRFSAIAEHIGYELEWSDEWSTCDDCGKAVRTSPDCYAWQPYYRIVDDCSIVCNDCIDWAAELESAQDNPDTAVPTDCNPAEYGYIRLSEPRQYEHGFHPGQTDNPAAILKAIHATGKSGVIFRIADKGQFDVHFETWIRIAHFELAQAIGSVALCGSGNDTDHDAPIVDDWRAVTCTACLARQTGR